ncbi:MAG: prolipoprotein diacylglyceryl transferase [Bacilli bacterium]|nr:prolipoprotein diacylglyceryl transferase [Bacilli bacterium]
MKSEMFDFGWIQIKWYSFFILIAMLLGCIVVYKEAIRKRALKEDLEDLLFYGLLSGILGARVYYVLFNLDYYLPNWPEVFQVWNGGLAIHGGIIGGLLFFIFYCRKKKWNLLLSLDIVVVGLILAQSIGRWGNFFNQEAYGRITSLKTLQNLHIPNFVIQGMYIDGFYREPTFLYESLFSFIGFLFLVGIRKISKLKVGQLCGAYLIWYGIERGWIEALRSDSLMLGNLKIAQVISIIFILVGIYFLIKNIKNNKYYKKEKILLENQEEVCIRK